MSPEYNYSDTYIDESGYEWQVNALIKTVNGREEIVSINLSSERGVLQRQTLIRLPIKNFIRKFVLAKNPTPLSPPDTARRGSHQGRASSDEELQEVVTAYMTAYSERKRIAPFVANALGISQDSAIKRIGVARKRGLLPARRGVSPMEI